MDLATKEETKNLLQTWKPPFQVKVDGNVYNGITRLFGNLKLTQEGPQKEEKKAPLAHEKEEEKQQSQSILDAKVRLDSLTFVSLLTVLCYSTSRVVKLSIPGISQQRCHRHRSVNRFH